MSDLSQAQLERLLTVGRSLVSARDPDQVLHLVIEAARDLTLARYAALGVLDDQGRELERFVYVGVDEGTRERIGALPRGLGILGELIRRPEPLRLRKIGDHPRSYGFPSGHPPMESFLGVPVRIRDRVYGNLYLTEKAGGEEFSDEDEGLLVVLSEWAAIAIDNARSLATAAARSSELERAMRGLEATASLNREVGGQTELNRVLELVVKRARALVEARACICFLADPNGDLRAAAVAGEVGKEVIGSALPSAGGGVSGALAAPGGIELDELSARQLVELGAESESGLLIPMRSRGLDIGVLVLLDRDVGGHRLDLDDLYGLESFAASAAGAVNATRAIEREKLRLSIRSSELERRRWARELHDETLQELGALRVIQEQALQVDDPEQTRGALSRAGEQVDRVIDALQGLITDLRPASLDQIGPQAAVEALVERVRHRAGLEVELDVDLAYEAGRTARRLTPELEAAIYRVTQEALTNVVKHAEARIARVLIEEDGAGVTVTVIVEDDGVGFDPPTEPSGFGLVGMQERAELLGGTFEIVPTASGGARVRAVFPVTRVAESGK